MFYECVMDSNLPIRVNGKGHCARLSLRLTPEIVSTSLSKQAQACLGMQDCYLDGLPWWLRQ